MLNIVKAILLADTVGPYQLVLHYVKSIFLIVLPPPQKKTSPLRWQEMLLGDGKKTADALVAKVRAAVVHDEGRAIVGLDLSTFQERYNSKIPRK